MMIKNNTWTFVGNTMEANVQQQKSTTNFKPDTQAQHHQHQRIRNQSLAYTQQQQKQQQQNDPLMLQGSSAPSNIQDKSVNANDNSGVGLNQGQSQHQNLGANSGSIINAALFIRCEHEGCYAYFTSYHDMNKHKALHSNAPATKQSSTAIRKAQFYQQAPQREGNHQCNVCGKTLSSRRCLKEHLQRHSGDKPFSCDIAGCGKRFVNDQSLADHRATHFDERPFKCDYTGCGKSFKNNGQLRGHRLAVHKPPNMRCQFYGCEYSARRSRHMQVHISKKHSEQLNRIGSILQVMPNEHH